MHVVRDLDVDGTQLEEVERECLAVVGGDEQRAPRSASPYRQQGVRIHGPGRCVRARTGWVGQDDVRAGRACDKREALTVYAIGHLQAGTGTWYWCVHFSRGGKLHYRRFYEPKYGGSEAARRAAIAWRDERLASTKVLGVLEFCQKKRSNNRSSVPGVHFLKPPAQPEGIWQAS